MKWSNSSNGGGGDSKQNIKFNVQISIKSTKLARTSLVFTPVRGT